MMFLPAIPCAVLAVAALVLAIHVHVWRRGSVHIVRAVPDAPAAPLGLVLGARVWPGGVPSHVLEDRLLVAHALLAAGKVERLLLSGDNRPGRGEVDVMHAFLLARGVPSHALLRDDAAATTHASLLRARDRFSAKRILLITQAFHLPRALYAAHRLGLSAHGVVADRRAYADMPRTQLREAAARLKAFLSNRG